MKGLPNWPDNDDDDDGSDRAGASKIGSLAKDET